MFDFDAMLAVRDDGVLSPILLQKLIEEIPVGVAVIAGPERRFLYANRAYRAISGDPGASLIGRTVPEIFPAISPAGLRVLDAVYATGQPQRVSEYEARLLPDTEPGFWDADHHPIRDGKGRVVAILIVAIDVTAKVLARREAEHKAAEAEMAQRLLDGLMRYVPEGITIAEPPDVTILRVSDYGRNLLGRSRDEIERIPAGDHVIRWDILRADGETTPDPAELPLTRATQQGEVVVNERWVLRAADGRKVPVLCNAGPILDEQGTIQYGVIAWRDISRLVEAEAVLKAVVAEKEMLVQEVNHRVKNSLQLISSLITLQGASVTDPRACEVLENVTRRVATVARIHERLYRGGATDRLDFADYLQDLSGDLVRSMAQTDSIEPPVIEADPIELPTDVALPLALIVSELVTNALKYAYPRHGGPIEIVLRRSGNTLCLSVADRGVGLPPGFDPRQSTGLGMTIVRAFVGQLGGHLEAVNRLPGACFIITIAVDGVG